MRKSLFLLAAFPLGALGQEQPKSLLWRISGADGQERGHLYGTVHSMDERAYQLGDSVVPALGRATVAAGELDFGMQGQAELMKVMMTIARLPDGMELKDLYSRKDWKVVEPALQAQLGPMSALVQRLKPIFAASMLSGEASANDRAQMLDLYLLEGAAANGKTVIGLETAQEQLRAMDAMPLPEQAQLLLDAVKDPDLMEREMNDLLDAYAAQDLDKLMAVCGNADRYSAVFQTVFLDERNVRMVHRMDSLMRTGPTFFFAVGAAHLPGPAGTIEGLRAKGWTVQPVISAHTRELPLSLGPEVDEESDAPVFPPHFGPPARMSEGIRFQDDTLGFGVDMPSPPQRDVIGGAILAGGRTVNWTAKGGGRYHRVTTLLLDSAGAQLATENFLEMVKHSSNERIVQATEEVPIEAAVGRAWRIDVVFTQAGYTELWQVHRPTPEKVFLVTVKVIDPADRAEAELFLQSFTPLAE